MKDILLNNMDFVVSFISLFVTYFLGIIAKSKKYISTDLIPIQNIIIMLLTIVTYYYVTGDLSLVVATGSPVATLLYDTYHNLLKEE